MQKHLETQADDEEEEDAVEGVFFDVHGEVFTVDEVIDRLLNSKDERGRRRFWARG